MQPRRMLLILLLLFILAASAFLFLNLTPANAGYHLPKRAIKLLALCVTGIAIALSTTVFQTISGNTILTPSILGLDSLYLLVQTIIVFLFGSGGLLLMSKNSEYLLSVGVMVLFSTALFSLLLGKHQLGLSMVLLMGMMFGQLFSALASFFQILIDPNEFLTVQARMFASFTMVNTNLLAVSTLIVGILSLVLGSLLPVLDVLALGRDIATNLGVPYQRFSRIFLMIVSLLVAVSTALVGPVTFLGLLVVSLARQLIKSHHHNLLFPTSILLSMTALVFGQLLVERLFNFSTPISVIINGIGGMYFLFLLLSKRRTS
ncbi:MAG: iron chelate uptake ABC transporter family permease subunit [Sphaerochaetaceae bacterium]